MWGTIGRGIGRGARGVGKLAARGAWGATKGIGRAGWRATKGLAGAAALYSGFAPAIGVAAGLGKRLFGSRRGGRGGGRGGGSSESETGLLNTSLLFQIRDEVVQIKGLLVTQQIPESERREKEFEEWRRHRELLSAISGLSLGGIGGGPGGKKDGGSLAKLLLGLLALTGLALLPKLLEKVPGIVDGIQSFLDKMALFLAGMWGVFKLLGKRAKAMKPPQLKAMKGPSRGKGRAAFIKRLKAARALRLAEKSRLKAKTAATNKIKAAEKAALKTTRLGGKTIPPEKASDKPPKAPKAATKGAKGGIGSRIGNWFAETGGKPRAVAEGKQAAERRAGRTIGGKTIAQERMDQPKGRGTGVLRGVAETEGKKQAVVEGKQAAARERAATEQRRLRGVRERLQVQQQKIIEGKAAQKAAQKEKSRFNRQQTNRAQSKILETRAQQIARQNFKTGQFPDTKIQNRQAIIKEAVNISRLEAKHRISGLTSSFQGAINNIYAGLQQSGIRMKLLGNSIQKGMGGLSIPEGGTGVRSGSPKVASPAAAKTPFLNEFLKGNTRGPRLGALGSPEGGSGGRPPSPKVTSSTAAKTPSLNEQSIRKSISKIFGSISPGEGLARASQTSSGSGWKPTSGTHLSKMLGVGSAAGPGTGAGSNITTESGVESRLINRVLGRVPKGLKGFAVKFLMKMRQSTEGLRKVSRIPGLQFLGKLLIITVLISEIGSLFLTRMLNPSAFKSEMDFWWEVGKVIGKLAAVLISFALITAAVGIAIAWAAPALAVTFVGGTIAAVVGFFITDAIWALINGEQPKGGDPYAFYDRAKQKFEDVHTMSWDQMGKGKDPIEKAMSYLIGGSMIVGASATEAAVKALEVFSGVQSPEVKKHTDTEKWKAGLGELFTGGDRQGMGMGPDFGTWSASQKTPPAPPPPKVKPDDILLKKNRRDRVIRTLNREFKSHQKTMLDDPSSKDRLLPRLAAINQEILNLINAPLNDDKTHFIVNHQEIKDVSMTTTTVTQSSSGFISYGTNINAHGFAPSGRY